MVRAKSQAGVTLIDDLVLASSNEGKLLEFQSLLAPYGLRLWSQRELGIEAPAEPHASFLENALTKARAASRRTGRAALADDSGICIALLKDQPGVLSARWAELHGGPHHDDANNKLVNQQLNGQISAAYFICVLVLLRWPEDPVPLIAEGRWHGRWLREARGEAGFGYDPHFLPDGQLLTAAEMPIAQKNSMSHRALPINRLIKQMLDLGLIVNRGSAGN